MANATTTFTVVKPPAGGLGARGMRIGNGTTAGANQRTFG